MREHIAGKADLEAWFDRSVHFDASNTPNGSVEILPCVITSRSLRNRGGGLLNLLRTKQQVKIDAVKRKLEQLNAGEHDVADSKHTMVARRELLKRVGD